jgi:predicted MFS family arabinose efflux permease
MTVRHITTPPRQVQLVQEDVMSTRELSTARLRTRLLPLYVAVGLQGFMLWLPIEKLFMNEIGFDAAAVGVMAAAYAGFVPLIEVPSGVLADRWSRRGVLTVASVALALTALIGGLSANVPMYIASALVLGVYFAMYSGTMDAIVYDTVVEETGDSTCFERVIGRVRFAESVTLVTSSLAGGWIANLTTPRLTYFLTAPFAALSIIALLRFREPTLHKSEEPVALRRQLAVTYRTLLRNRSLLPIVVLAVLTGLIMQTVFEFGPLWLVALAVPAVVYGPYWAGLVSTLGLGGVVAGRISFDRPATAGLATALMLLAAVTLALSTNVVAVMVAQVALLLFVAVAAIHVTRRMHDAVPSTVRSGVASGIGALSWIVFLPFALGAGQVTDSYGVHVAGWMVTAVTAAAGVLWVAVAARRATRPAPVTAGAGLEPECAPALAGAAS